MKNLTLAMLLTVAGLANAGIGQKADVRKATQQRTVDVSAPSSIGSAAMLADRTIVMRVYAPFPGGGFGEAEFTYKVTDPDYNEVLRHLGGLKPGESKPVPPWPAFDKPDNRH